MMRWVVIFMLLASPSVADTLGYYDTTVVGVNGIACTEDTVRGKPAAVWSGTDSAWVDTIWAYLDLGGNRVKAAIYDDNVFHMGSEEKTIATSGREWVAFALTDTAFLRTDTGYVILVWSNDSTAGADGLGKFFNLGESASLFWDDASYGAWPTPAYNNAIFTRGYIYAVTHEPVSGAASPNAIHDKSADPTTGALHDKEYGSSVLHEP